MQIVNGRWVDDNFNPLDERTSPQLMELGRKVSSIYGKNITHDRIMLVNQLSNLDSREERGISRIIEEGNLNKLLGL